MQTKKHTTRVMYFLGEWSRKIQYLGCSTPGAEYYVQWNGTDSVCGNSHHKLDILEPEELLLMATLSFSKKKPRPDHPFSKGIRANLGGRGFFLDRE